MDRNCLCFEDHNPASEMTPLFISPKEKCRLSRTGTAQSFRGRAAMAVLTVVLRSSGYHCSGIVSQMYSSYLLLVCLFQVAYSAYVSTCWFGTVCEHSTWHLAQNEQIGVLVACMGAAGSYISMLFCVILPSRKYSVSSVAPSEGLRDLKAGKLTCLLFWLVLISVLFVAYAFLYFWFLVVKHSTEVGGDTVVIIGTIAILTAVWTSIASCFAFGISALALGTFADDTVRRLKEMNGDSLDDAIIIHRELKLIVSSTVGVFSKWFIIHWFLYALTSVISLIVVADVKFKNEATVKKLYFGLFFASHVFLFVFPCGCAAYVTSVCGAVAKKLNNTLSTEWKDGHLFKNRGILQQFVSYALGSPVTFKIGRVTFNTTIAWVSFFLGFTGLLFHFF